MNTWTFGRFWCEIWLAFDVLLVTASIMNLCLISIDRYFSITRPIAYTAMRTPKRVLGMIATVWGLSLIISMPPLVGWRPTDRKPGQCSLSNDIGYVLYSAIGSFFIPVTVLLLVYFKIFMITRQRAQLQLNANKKRERQLLSRAESEKETMRLQRSNGSQPSERRISAGRRAEMRLKRLFTCGNLSRGKLNLRTLSKPEPFECQNAHASAVSFGDVIDRRLSLQERSASRKLSNEIVKISDKNSARESGRKSSVSKVTTLQQPQPATHITNLPKSYFEDPIQNLMQMGYTNGRVELMHNTGSQYGDIQQYQQQGLPQMNIPLVPKCSKRRVFSFSTRVNHPKSRTHHRRNSEFVADADVSRHKLGFGKANSVREPFKHMRRSRRSVKPDIVNRSQNNEAQTVNTGTLIKELSQVGGPDQNVITASSSISNSNSGSLRAHNSGNTDQKQADNCNGINSIQKSSVITSAFPTQENIAHNAILQKQRYVRKKEMRATLVLGIVMAAFVGCWLPFFGLYLASAFGANADEIVFDVFFWMGYVNSALNPPVYTLFNAEFKKAFKKLLGIRERSHIRSGQGRRHL